MFRLAQWGSLGSRGAVWFRCFGSGMQVFSFTVWLGPVGAGPCASCWVASALALGTSFLSPSRRGRLKFASACACWSSQPVRPFWAVRCGWLILSLSGALGMRHVVALCHCCFHPLPGCCFVSCPVACHIQASACLVVFHWYRDLSHGGGGCLLLGSLIAVSEVGLTLPSVVVAFWCHPYLSCTSLSHLPSCGTAVPPFSACLIPSGG